MRVPALLLILCLLGGCLWRSYETIMRVHVDVLTSVLSKVADKIESGRPVTPADITELTYPLQRARQFARQYQSEAQRDSHRRFVELLDRFESLVDSIDRARTDEERWRRLRPRLDTERREILRLGEEVRAALKQESESAAAWDPGTGTGLANVACGS